MADGLASELNGLTITPPSIGDINDLDEAGSAALEQELKDFTNALEGGRLSGYSNGSSAKTVIKEAQETLQLVKETRKRKQKKKVLVLPFSEVRQRHLAAFGVEFPKQGVAPMAEVLSAVNTLLDGDVKKWYTSPTDDGTKMTLKECVETFWKSVKVRLTEHMEDVVATTCLHTEDRSRMLINTCMSEVIYLLRRRLHLPSLIYPEVVIATSSDPVEIEYEDNVTIFTGRVDYCVFTQFGGNMKVDGPNETRENMTKAREAENITAAFETVLKMAVGKYFEMFIIEAKRFGLILRDLLPQVIAECTASAHALPEERKSAVFWCLTDGAEWIFGVISTVNEKQLVYQAESIQIQTMEEKLKVKSSKKTVTEIRVQEKELKEIFLMLVCWCTQQAAVLVREFHQISKTPSA